jgi:hypothetical protein
MMKNGGAAIAALVTLGLALFIALGSRLSDQALSALAGAACGIGLAGPIGFGAGLYIGSTRRHAQTTHAPSPPQVIVVPAPQPLPPAQQAIGYPPVPGAGVTSSRSFTIIGEEDD